MWWIWKRQSSWNDFWIFILLRTSRWCLFHYFEAISSSLHLYIHRITPCFHTIAPNSTRDQITPHLEPSGDCMETRLKTKQSKPLICWLLFIRQWFAWHCMSWAAIQKCSMTPNSINPSVGWGTIHKDLFITRLPRFHLDLALACALVSKFVAVFRVFA